MACCVIRIAIAGHRRLGDVKRAAFVAHMSMLLLEEACHRHGEVSAVSALAEGADTLFAETALLLGIPLKVVRPFDEYERDFPLGAARSRYQRLRQAAWTEEILSYESRSERAYSAAMRRVVRRSDMLVAAWDRRRAACPGGTAEAVEHALSTGRDVIHLDIADLRVRRSARA
jgi:hypothetical protein